MVKINLDIKIEINAGLSLALLCQLTDKMPGVWDLLQQIADRL